MNRSISKTTQQALLEKMKTKQTLPVFGATRTKQGYLFLPKLIKGKWKWLVHAKWVQKVEKTTLYNAMCGTYQPGEHWQYVLTWVDVAWSEENDAL